MYQQIKLPYSFSSFVPMLSEKSLKNHYESHYIRYLKQLNQLLANQNFSFSYGPALLYRNIDAFPIVIRDDLLFQAGGVLNHELYFQSISPKRIEVPEPLKSRLVEKFGGVGQFEDRFFSLAEELPGSGYTFLAVNASGDLILLNLANQDSPYMFGMTPILAFDVWEHSYYLDYLNHRAEYLENMIPFLNYHHINQLYEQVLKEQKKAT